MKRRYHLMGILAVLLVGTGTAMADGILVPGRWPPPRPIHQIPPAFAIKYHHVDVTIDGQVARTHIDQVFQSEADREIEATYLFPIPEGATIQEFSLWNNGEKVAGKVLDKKEARRIYEEIVRQRKDPALLEYVDRGLFKARIFPIPPRGEQRIEIEYTEILDRDNNLVGYTYPLNTEKFSSRPIESVRISVDIKADAPIKNVYSPTHDASVRRPTEYKARISHEESNTKPDIDFTVYYSLSEDDIGLSLLTYQPDQEDGYFLFLASPRAEIQEDRISAKDIVFVFDRTGSMQGEKIEQAKEALEFSLKGLNRRDRFNVIAFNESPDPLFSELQPATQANIDRALELVERLTAEGGTNIDEALTTALPMLRDRDRPSFLLFLTDGLPTVGVSDPKAILAHAADAAPEQARLFAFGVGYDVNTFLLDKLAVDHSGVAEYVRPGEDLEVKVSSLYRKISYPILSDVTVAFDGISTYDQFPNELPDLFKGSQIVLTGRFRGSGRTEIALAGKAGGKTHRFDLRQRVSGQDDEFDFIPALWANRKIAYLLSEIRLGGDNKELVDEVIRLSKKFGIITEYTSFLVETPDILFARDFEEEAGTTWGRVNEKKLRMQSGGSAVNQSLNIGRQAKASNAPAPNVQVYYDKDGRAVTIKQVFNVANRTFFQKGKNWIENTYTEGIDVLKVQNYSPAQFQLLERDPSLGKLMSLGEEVLLMINGKAVQIGAEGLDQLSENQMKELFGA